MWRAQYGTPASRSAPAPPQKKYISVPGLRYGQRQHLFVSSNKVLPCRSDLTAGDLAGLKLRRRRVSGSVVGAATVVWAAGFFLAAPAGPSRSRKILPSTADRDRPPSFAPIAWAVSPSAQSLFSKL